MEDVETRLGALEAEVRRLKDHLAIHQIVARYGPLVDSTGTDEARLRKAGEFFGETGIYDLSDTDKFTGAEFAATLSGPPHQDYVRAGSTHVMSMPYVLVAGDRATALGYSHVFQNAHDGTFRVVRASVNYWEFERRDGAWQVVRRTNRLADGTEAPRQLLFNVDTRSLMDQSGPGEENGDASTWI